MKTAQWICFVAVGLLGPTVLAATEGMLAASPAVVMLRGNSGQSTTQTLTIMNSTTQPYAFEMIAKDVVVRDGKRSLVKAGELSGGIAATAVFSPKSGTVMPGEKRSVTATLTIPATPSVRAVICQFHGTTKMNSRGMRIVASLGILMTFATSDQVLAEASPLKVFAATPSSNLHVGQRLTNTGTEPLFAKGVLAIVNASGTLVAKNVITGRRLLPGERTEVRADYTGDLRAGHYRALVTYDLQNASPITSSAEFDIP